MSVRIGVVGLGRIGRMHARNIAQEDGVDELVLIGRSEDKLQDAKAQLHSELAEDAGPQLRGAHAPSPSGPVPQVDTVLLTEDWTNGLDGVIIASSTHTHPDLARSALAAGVPVLLEKPIGLKLEETAALSAEFESLNVPIMVAYHRRYDEGFQNLRERIHSGDLGTIRVIHSAGHDHFHVDPEFIPTSGGVWRDLLIHEFDTIPWLLGQTPVWIFASGAVLDEQAYADSGDLDTATAVITFESGVQALISGARNIASGQDVNTVVYGSDAAFAAGIDSHSPVISTEPGVAPPESTYADFIERFEPAFRREVRHFLAVINGDATSLTLPSDGIVAARLALAAEESVRCGTPVALDAVTV
ncbi:Gfo/Idh/MocA family protein [Brevibacterium sp. UCMA 11754]|uniref:Gfo/Idh/MocA family protein n=1 Tax=Brevibacterium sp. UCMA 11754 TaxID=2749198 RepID=UPI001F2EBD54|nr:Gfo/Idh/MocA family oxidoreductase [Brevibacterium sp. UCMA 11754]MCF2570695.1 Gfo/Idh/MocA family oxidoreductase [Brevibacterium sp. UCMA 11754]